jgi:hypothetical protein
MLSAAAIDSGPPIRDRPFSHSIATARSRAVRSHAPTRIKWPNAAKDLYEKDLHEK